MRFIQTAAAAALAVILFGTGAAYADQQVGDTAAPAPGTTLVSFILGTDRLSPSYQVALSSTQDTLPATLGYDGSTAIKDWGIKEKFSAAGTDRLMAENTWTQFIPTESGIEKMLQGVEGFKLNSLGTDRLNANDYGLALSDVPSWQGEHFTPVPNWVGKAFGQ